jgi:hypothetical protein
MFKGLTLEKAKELLKKYTKKEILRFFKTEEDLYEFMIKIPQNKEKLLLKFLNN